MPIKSLLADTSPRSRLILGAVALGLVGFLLLVFKLASQPSFATVLTGLDPAQTGKITAALDERGVGYEIRSNGTALAVEKAQVAQARIALAEQGLAGAGKPGFELFDKQKLGSSDFQQQVTYQRALEGEIANTIRQVQGVTDAQVQLVMPKDQLFADGETPATAAVLLSGAAATLDPGAVRGIASLVASSVQGLKPQNVSITDASGQLVWPTGEVDGTAAAGVPAKQAAQSRYDAQLAGGLTALLAQTVGPDKARVQVTSDLNVDQATEEKLSYAKKGVPLRQQKDVERLKGAGGGASGVAGSGSNIPSYAGGGASGGSSDYRHETSDTTYGVDKTVTRTKLAPGTINRLSVALVVDEAVPGAQVEQLRDAVTAAAGIVPSRGDTLTVSRVAFSKPEPSALGGPVATILSGAKYAALALGLLAFLFLATRHLRRREGESLGEPTWLRQIEAPATLAQLEHETTVAEAPLPLPVSDPARRRVEDLAERDPARVAQQVRTWLQED
ncbi:MAG: flagellar M-ring protein FliF [Solirubrobacteraceae bacterium]|nr:flagellar M-ring protein FliF [Solirubrobacteraceae bacterium]